MLVRVVSALLYTWVTLRERRLCPRCARRAAWRALTVSALFGWWGVPFGWRTAGAVLADRRVLLEAARPGRPGRALAALAVGFGPMVLAAAALAAVLIARPRRPAPAAPATGERLPAVAAYLSDEAKHFRNTGRWEQAEKLLRAALREAPRSVALRRQLAGALARLDGYDTATDLIRGAIEIDPNRAVLYADLARVHFEAGRWGDAETAIREAYQRAPHDRAIRADLGAIIMHASSPAEALPHLQAVCAVGAPNAHLECTLAECLFYLGHIEEAAEQFHRCAGRLPRSLQVQSWYQDAMIASGHLEDVRTIYTKRAPKGIASPAPYCLLARLYPPSKEAAEALRQALAADGDDPFARSLWARHLSAADRFRQALVVLGYGPPADDTRHPRLLDARVSVLADAGRLPEAMRIQARRIRRRPHDARLRVQLIDLLAESGALDEADEAVADAEPILDAAGPLMRARLLRAAAHVDAARAARSAAFPAPAGRPATRRATTAPADPWSVRAVARLDKAEALAVGHPLLAASLQVDRFFLHVSAGNTGAALARFGSMNATRVRLMPEQRIRLLLWRGLLLARRGRLEGAATDWRRLTEAFERTPVVDTTCVLAARHLLGATSVEAVETALGATPVRDRAVLYLSLAVRAREDGRIADARRAVEDGLSTPRRPAHATAMLRAERAGLRASRP